MPIAVSTPKNEGVDYVRRNGIVRSLLVAAALVLAGSAGMHIAHAQTGQVPSFLDSIFVFYAEDRVSDQDIADALGPALRHIPHVWAYEVPSTDLTYILRHLSNVSAISFDEPPLDKAPDLGDFILEYGANPSSEYEPTAREWLLDNGLLEYEVEWLNENFRLPYDVYVVAEECEEENAFYYPSTKEVVICYEFVDGLFDRWDRHNDDPDGAADFAYDVTTMVLYHEIGHAILDIYELPYTGLQENVADQFAALVLSYTYDEDIGHDVGQNMMFNVALNYKYIALDRAADTVIPYWGVHGLDEQRHYNILCYAYGANPVYNQDLTDNDWLPEDRVGYCEEEYKHIERAFSHLLSYHTNGFFD